MKIIKYISMAFVLVIIFAWLAVNYVVINIPVGKVGVCTQEYAFLSKKGVVPKDFGPGWHLDVGPIHTWREFDSTVQTLEMTRDPNRGDKKERDDVQVQSADGYAVSVDVTVKYRIMKGKAHKVYQDTGSGIKYKTIVRSQAQKACQSLFGQMETEDFYNPKKRRFSNAFKAKLSSPFSTANSAFSCHFSCSLRSFSSFPSAIFRLVIAAAVSRLNSIMA
jgi:regulator of protease activity HflC (stomatin/prohibitin superfamily)